MSYFIYNGTDSRNYGILERCPVPPTAAANYETIKIPGKSENIVTQTETYNDISLKCTLGLKDKSVLRSAYQWLSGTGELILSKNTAEKYIVKKIAVNSEYVSERFAKIAVTFTCSPFAYAVESSVYDVGKGFTEVPNKGTMYSAPTITFDVIPAEAPMLMGDVNFDGVVDASDASLVSAEYNRILNGEELTFTPEQNAAADMNGNGEIDLQDVSLILSAYAQNQTDHSYSAVAEKYVNINVNGEELVVGLPSAAVRSGYPVTIDCSVPLLYYTTSDGKKVNIMQYSKGDFPLLKTGINYVKYSGDVENVKISVNERWK